MANPIKYTAEAPSLSNQGALPRFMVCSSWAPPMVGGPRVLYLHLKGFHPEQYSFVTSFCRITNAQLDPNSMLPARYYFYDVTSDKEALRQPLRQPVYAYPVLRWFIRKALRYCGWFRPARILIQLAALGEEIYEVVAAGLKAHREGKTDIIVGVSDDGPCLLGSFFLSMILRKPLVLYFLDLYTGNSFGKVLDAVARLFEPLLLHRASQVVVSNEAAQRYFEDRYSTLPRITVVRNGTDSEKVHPTAESGKKFRIVFTGDIYWAQRQAVENLLDAIPLLEDLPLEVRLFSFYVPPELKLKAEKLKNVTLRGIPQTQISQELANADLLFLPMSWTCPAPQIIKTASPMKLSEYLCAGKPILGHGPNDSYIVDFVRGNGCGPTVTDNSPEVLAASIRRHFSLSSAEREFFSMRCSDVFTKYFAAETNREKLKAVFMQVFEETGARS